MRYVSIDLSSDNYLHQPQIFGGYAGEHNETILQVKLPKRMIDIECSGYRFDFQTSEDNKISSPLIPVYELNDDVLSFKLAEQLTVAGKLLFNVVATLLSGNTVSLTSKTNMIVLHIGESPEGNDIPIDPNGYKDELLQTIDNRILEIKAGKKTEMGGEIFNDYENNSANVNAHSEGENNAAGAKAFKILSFDAENKAFTLDSTEGLEINDEYSCQLNANFDFAGKIVEINEVTKTIAEGYAFAPDSPLIFNKNVSMCRIINTEPMYNRGGLLIYASEWTDKGDYLTSISCTADHSTAPYWDMDCVLRVEGTTLNINGTAYNSYTKEKLYDINETVTIPEGTLIGAIAYSFENGYNFKVTTLEHLENTISVDTIPTYRDTEWDTQVSEKSKLWIPTKPTVGTIDIGIGSHAEGGSNIVSQLYGHTEGYKNITSGKYGHTEGRSNKAGYAAHSEGQYTIASGLWSHSQNFRTQALGDHSSAGGEGTIAREKNQNVIGSFNKDNPDAIHIIGNGSSNIARSNAFEVLKDGSANIGTQGYLPKSIVQLDYLKNNYKTKYEVKQIQTESKMNILYINNAVIGKECIVNTGLSMAGVKVYNKNLLYPDANYSPSTTYPTIKRTINSDGSVQFNGYVPNNEDLPSVARWGYAVYTPITNSNPSYLPEGKYRLSGIPKTDTVNNYTLKVRNSDTNKNVAICGANGDPYTIFDIPAGGLNIYVMVNLKCGLTLNNVIFKPMIELVTDDTSEAIEFVAPEKPRKYISNSEGSINFKTTSETITILKDNLTVDTDMSLNCNYKAKFDYPFTVADDGTAELTKMGNSNKSIVTKEYVNGNFANALKGNIEGTAVAIHDVSPIEHTLSVRLSGNEDLESVKLLQYGKNIYKPKSIVPYGTVSLIEVATVNEDGGIVLKGTAADSSVSYHLDLPSLPVGTYAFNGTNPNVKYYVFTLTSSGEEKTWINNFFTLDDGDRLEYLQLRIPRGVTIDDTFYVQIELAKKSTEYTPYIEPKEYKADADGTVKGVTSLYPDMTLLTDTSGVTVRCEYNRDINKAFAAIEKAVSAFSGESNA